ncbi:Rid family detoxifying hydrolase [Cytophagaceae bacterium DM2B3-1]|uniref:Rid family detoxifying hydrolase n=2 Tax=Xanthocytophaga TaxID=3078918 RepID=A0ABT7CKV4_9BACT|nr:MULTISPECIES: Rid family detoxifying hydrolase [Xanthocytophaga]MDJ1469876.1 Rid family detoxifying hydrolase [Xanthocytophaga flavus]MDJ1494388.1 Rid family detoxifying hydrolase [Xanthocytophaga flavus]MDJ1503199.1 Rid family detoxifying hydrolase [Xanthocytophaga agilis]
MKKIPFLIFFITVLSTSAVFAQKKIVKTEEAPLPVGPYSQGVIANGFFFGAGQTGVDPKTRKLVEGGIEQETTQTLENIKAVLKAANLDLTNVVNATVYLKDMNDFAKMNAIYGKYFSTNPPARTTISIVSLPGGANVEIAVVAVLKK